MKTQLSHIAACCLLLLIGCQAPPTEITQPPPAPATPPATQPKQLEPGIATELKQKIDKLVRQLAADDFATREAADKELRKLLLDDTKNFDFALSHLKHHLDTITDAEVKTRLERMKIEQCLEWGITGPILAKFPDILTQLTSPDVRVRTQIAKELGESNHPDAINPVIKTLRDTDEKVCGAAIGALVKIGVASLKENNAVNPVIVSLIKALGHTEAKVRYAAAHVLAIVKDTRLVEPLIRALGDMNPRTRKGAATVLGAIKDARAFQPLIKTLTDSAWSVRAEAAWALGQIKDAKAVEPLMEVLDDKIYWVRYAAAGALGKLGEAKAVASLIQTLGDKDADVRAAAAKALGEIKDSRAVEPLAKLLRNPKTYHSVHDVVTCALAEIGRSSVEPLIEALDDSDARNLAGKWEDF
jgi:HEAT repeat protein